MRRLLVTGAVVGLVMTGAPSVAHAAAYEGGCGFVALYDFTGGEAYPVALRGEHTWLGVVFLAVAPVGSNVTVTCDLWTDAPTPETVLTATGTGVVVAAAPLIYATAPGQVVKLCTTVSEFPPTVCRNATETKIVPSEVTDLLATPKHLLDPALCTALKAAAPVIKSLGHPEVVDADPGSGDLYLLERDDSGAPDQDDPEFGWDCPPYTTDAPLNMADEVYLEYVLPT